MSEILEQLHESDSVLPRVITVSKPRVATPYVVAKMVQFKAENPSIFAWEIRERLLNESICSQDHLPSISSINRILHKISTSSVSVKPTFNHPYHLPDFYWNNSFNLPVPSFGLAFEETNNHLTRNSNETTSINRMPYANDHEQIIYNNSDFKISYKGKLQVGRTSFTKEQLVALEKEFERTHYPDVFARKRLSKQIRMDENRIQVWFSNRRAKWRREENARAAKRVHTACASSPNTADLQPTVTPSKSAFTIKSNILQRYFSSENLQNQKTPSFNNSCSSSTDNFYETFRLPQISPPPYNPCDYNALAFNAMHQSSFLHPASLRSSTYWNQF